MVAKKAVTITSEQIDNLIDSLKDKKCGKCRPHHNGGCGMYGLGAIGAFVFYAQHAVVFSDWIVAIFKAVFWPAFFVYKLLTQFPF
jgi:hypothetical protein